MRGSKCVTLLGIPISGFASRPDHTLGPVLNLFKLKEKEVFFFNAFLKASHLSATAPDHEGRIYKGSK